MPLTIQTIEELEKLAKEEPCGLDEDYCAADNGNYDDTFQDGYKAGQVDMARSLTDILSAAKWALEAGYGQESEDEIVESPDMRAAKVFKNGFEVTYVKDGITQ